MAKPAKQFDKAAQHRMWRHWSKQNLTEDTVNPMYNRYSGYND